VVYHDRGVVASSAGGDVPRHAHGHSENSASADPEPEELVWVKHGGCLPRLTVCGERGIRESSVQLVKAREAVMYRGR